MYDDEDNDHSGRGTGPQIPKLPPIYPVKPMFHLSHKLLTLEISEATDDYLTVLVGTRAKSNDRIAFSFVPTLYAKGQTDADDDDAAKHVAGVLRSLRLPSYAGAAYGNATKPEALVLAIESHVRTYGPWSRYAASSRASADQLWGFLKSWYHDKGNSTPRYDQLGVIILNLQIGWAGALSTLPYTGQLPTYTSFGSGFGEDVDAEEVERTVMGSVKPEL